MSNKTIEELLGRSNRLGSNPKFTNYAGGNTSAKGAAKDPSTGKDVEVLYVKGSGGAVSYTHLTLPTSDLV